ncbi:unnamed protein product [Lasius platythorax]|uniref:Uncharacterized protein n=1 Tax=Lasius platythorax TaxID=488582 RepID=A0AAV2NXN9_9HYME
MENYTVGNINNDFLSQSYSQSIERIAGTKDHIFNFQIPKKLLEVRKKAWVNLFGKYSEEMSDDIELNVDTLEPDEEEKEKEVSVKEYSCGQRIPMRKSATLIQYWINTGNPPYKAFLDENELSETGASLSEKEITLSLYSSIPNVINNEGNKQEFKNIELCSMSKEYIASKTYDQPTINIVTTGNTIQPNMYSQSCEKTDKMNVLSTSQRSLDIQSRDDIVRQFDQTSKRLTGDGENNSASNQDEVLEKDTFCKKGMSEDIIAQEIITKDTSLTALYRKKLYTGRNSPVDLILTKRHSINRLSEAKQSLHPALDSDYMIKRETLLVRKGKNKKLSLYGKKNLGSGKTKRKKKRKRSSISDKNITDTNNELPNNRIQNYIINSSFNISSDYNNSDKRDDILLSEHNNANIFVKDEMRKQNLASLNLNPVVLLERITPSFKRHESKSAENTQNHITRENSVHDYKYLNKSNKLYTCEIENVELETIDSDESTILICQCKANAQQCASKESDCSLNLRLSIEDDFFTSSTEEKDGELSSLKNTDISQNKESYSTTLEELPPRLSVNEDCTNVKSREIKVILEQSPSAMESQSLKKDDTVRQNNVSNKSKTFSSNSYGANKIGNVRFREIKVILERLPVSAMESQILNKDDIVRQNNVLNKSKTLSSSSYGANKTGNVRSREIKVTLERLPALVNKNCTNTIIEPEILNNNDGQQKEILNKFKTHSSNPSGINRTDNAKLREIKIALERLPPNICFNDTNIFTDKNIISENINLHNNKRERRIKKISKISAYENVEASIQTVDKIDNYSLRMHTKSKEYNDPRISDTSDNVAEHQIFDKTESDSLFQYKNHSKVSQGNDNKYSVLSLTSSDEDDFVRLIQRPKKRLKFSKNDKLLDETNIEKNLCDETNLVTNKDKCYYSRNLSTVIFSSKEAKTKEIFESIKERKGSNRIEIKSFDNTASLQMCKNGKFLFSSNESDNDSVVKNLDKRKKRASFLNYNKSINNNNERHSNAIVKRNGINYKDDTGAVFFQTKMFNTDSSDSEESNSYTAPTRKAFKNSFVYHKSQYYNHAHLEESFNDSIAKRYSRKHSSSLHSSFEKHNITNRIHDIKVGLGSTSKKAKISKQLANEEFNDNINSRINNTRKNMSPSSFINDTSIRDTTTQKEMFSSSLGKNNFSSLSKNKQISDKFKNSAAIQQDDVKSTKLLMFQTKTYYDSDSNESL